MAARVAFSKPAPSRGRGGCAAKYGAGELRRGGDSALTSRVVPAVAIKPAHATLDDLLAIPASERFHEIIDGELVRKAMPSLRHGLAQAGITEELGGPFGPRSRGRGPGGWIFATEVEILFAPSQIYRPDVAGWRRERLPGLSLGSPVTLVPDWVCEILSPSNAGNDLIRKMRVYQRYEVRHYWLLDPDDMTLAIYRWSSDGYVIAQTAAGAERIRPEPFNVVEVSVQSLVEGDEGS